MKLYKFDDFLFESFMMSLNESVIQYSEKFHEILTMIDSPIAKELLDVYNQDKEVKTNWFDIGKDQDHLTFLIDAKAQKMENPWVKVIVNSPLVGYYYRDFYAKIGFEYRNLHMPYVGEVGKILKSENRSGVDFYLLSFSEDDSKQCVIRKDFTEPDQGLFWTKNRQEIRVGRGVRALLQSLKLEFSDAQIEDFVNRYKAAFEIAKDAFRHFELVRGNKIAELYHEDNYLQPDVGDIGNSCMKKKPSWYFGIYTQNSSVCSLLVLKSAIDPTKIVGRAIVWNLTEPDIMYMDRIYANKPGQMELFRRYAQSQGWYYKKRNDNSASTDVVGPDGKETSFNKLEVRIKALDYTGFPYVDTLKYFSEGSRFHMLSTDSMGHDKLLEDTDGNWVSDECECCGGSGRQGCESCDATGSIDCEECDKRGEVTCDDCDGEGKKDCESCDGTGEVDGETCEDCDGKKVTDCDNCDGDGTVKCDNCRGDGEYTCGDCDGDGQIDCGCCS